MFASSILVPDATLTAAPLLAFAPLVALLPVLKVVLPIVLPPVMAWAGYRLDAWIATKTKNEKLVVALSQFRSTLADAVLAVQQTYVDDLLEASADGTLSASEKAQALTKARDLVLATLPPEIKKLLQQYYGDTFGVVLETMIEAGVSRLKPSVASSLEVKRASAVDELRELAKVAGLDAPKKK